MQFQGEEGIDAGGVAKEIFFFGGGRHIDTPNFFMKVKPITRSVATQIFFFIFTPMFGEMIQFDFYFFRMGFHKPKPEVGSLSQYLQGFSTPN